MEILLAPLVGALSDSIGRKPVLLLTLMSVLVVNAVAACFPVVPLIVASTFISKCVRVRVRVRVRAIPYLIPNPEIP